MTTPSAGKKKVGLFPDVKLHVHEETDRLFFSDITDNEVWDLAVLAAKVATLPGDQRAAKVARLSGDQSWDVATSAAKVVTPFCGYMVTSAAKEIMLTVLTQIYQAKMQKHTHDEKSDFSRLRWKFQQIRIAIENMDKITSAEEEILFTLLKQKCHELMLRQKTRTLADTLCFSGLTDKEMMAFFCKGPLYRFELCGVLIKYIRFVIPLKLFGSIQAAASGIPRDPASQCSGVSNLFNRKFSYALEGSYSLHNKDISRCSLPVSANSIVQITARLNAASDKVDCVKNSSDYDIKDEKWRPEVVDESDGDDEEEEEDDEDEILAVKKLEACYKALGISRSVSSQSVSQSVSKSVEEGIVKVEYNAHEVCDVDALIDLSDYFTKKPNGGSGSYVSKGKDGSLHLYYVALKYAVDATVEVHYYSEVTRLLVGNVVAYYGKNFDYSNIPSRRNDSVQGIYADSGNPYNTHRYCSTLLDDYVKNPGKLILGRSVLAVPAQFSLIIKANLRVFDAPYKPANTALSGCFEFPVPRDGRSSHGVIKGNDCSLKLIVHWKLPSL